MTPSPSPLEGFTRGVVRGLATLAGLVFALSAFLLMIGAVAIGLTAAAGYALWSLVRGRRPQPVRFHWQSHRFRGVRPGAPPADGEVVDVEVRELNDERPERGPDAR